MSEIPQLPKTVSNDGREIWDWAGRLGEWTARQHRKQELRRAILQSKECGSCDFWMTSSCPREKHDNRLGRSVGPSCRGAICEKFSMKSWDVERVEKLQAELASLEDAPTPERR